MKKPWRALFYPGQWFGHPCTRPTIQNLCKYSGDLNNRNIININIYLSDIQMAFKYQTIWKNYRPFESRLVWYFRKCTKRGQDTIGYQTFFVWYLNDG